MSASDQFLLEDAVAGHVDSLTSLLSRYEPKLQRFLTPQIPAYLRPLVSADDVIQETYAEVFLDIVHFRPEAPAAFEAWLSRMAQNNLTDAVRGLMANKRDGKYRRNNSELRNDTECTLLELLSSGGTTPTEGARRNELEGILKRALDALPDAYREIVELYDLQERRVTDVAEILQCSPGAVYMRRTRAHRMLREILARFSEYA